MVNIYEWLFGPDRLEILDDNPPGFPVALLPYHAAIEATRRPIIEAFALQDGLVPKAAAPSQLGGDAWWPDEGLAYPTDADGRGLFLLAQINFDDTPTLDPFPDKGVLQFFIAADDLFGCDFDNPAVQNGFRLAYHASTDCERMMELPTRRHNAPDLGRGSLQDYSPLEAPLIPQYLGFATSTMLIDTSDYRFDTMLPEISDDDQLLQAYEDLANRDVPPLRLGGYPTFTQQDPRAYATTKLGDFSLLTSDTMDGIMWGDCGVAQFFATADDVRRLDFSRAAYNWDCC